MAKKPAEKPAEKLAKILEGEQAQEENIDPSTLSPEEVMIVDPETGEQIMTEEELTAALEEGEKLTEEEKAEIEKSAISLRQAEEEAEIARIEAEKEEEVKAPRGPMDEIMSEIAEMQLEEIKSDEQIAQEYLQTISDENMPPVILEGAVFYVVDNKYVPEAEALVTFQRRKIVKELKKYKQLVAKLKK